MIVELTRALHETLLTRAAAAHPHECCGLLLGEGATVSHVAEARNVHPEPARHFEIDPQVLIDAHRAARGGGPHLVGYYHSHPAGPPEPSPTDCACAARDGRIWIIVGKGEVRCWRDDEAGFEPLPLRLVDG